MKRRLTLALLAFVLTSGALANELPPTVAPPRPLPYWEQSSVAPKYFTWTGGYIGAQIGGSFQQLTDAASAPFLPAIAGVPGLPGYLSTSYDSSGVTYGGHLGFNYQFAPNFVAGLEGDGEGSSAHHYGFSYGAGFGPVSLENYSNYRASIRGRFGYAQDHWLLYATAGAAWANFQTTRNFAFPGNTDVSNFTPVGWTVGGGVEYAFMGNLSARLEYRYTDYGSATIYSQAPGLVYTSSATEHSVRGGITYRFWAPPPPAYEPVAAKY